MPNRKAGPFPVVGSDGTLTSVGIGVAGASQAAGNTLAAHGTAKVAYSGAKLASKNNNGKKGGGRSKNDLKYDENAEGDHTTYKRDPKTGKINHYETYKKADSRNPNKFEKVKRYDGEGESHMNKVTGENIDTPHVHDKTAPGGIRKATSEEMPK